MPNNNSKSKIIEAATQLTHALLNPMSEVPFHHVRNDNIIALKKLANIFKMSTEQQNNDDSVQRVVTKNNLQKIINDNEHRNDKNENSRKKNNILTQNSTNNDTTQRVIQKMTPTYKISIKKRKRRINRVLKTILKATIHKNHNFQRQQTFASRQIILWTAKNRKKDGPQLRVTKRKYTKTQITNKDHFIGAKIIEV